MSDLPARAVMRQVAEAIPGACRRELIVMGSLAAAYHFADQMRSELSTKDVDGMLSPNAHAVRNGQAIAKELFKAGWKQREDAERPPGDALTPVEALPFLRLFPPGNSDWFLELAAAPPAGTRAKSTA